MASAAEAVNCFHGFLGQSIDCGGGYVVTTPAAQAQQPAPPTHHSTSPTTIVLAYYVANGPNGPCMALGPANPTPNATVTQWLATVHFPNCPAARPGANLPVIDPATLAVQFWRTIPLPVPRPTIPPGYAVTGKTAYLVTNGTTDPPVYVDNTPLGQLTVQATGKYLVDWGDGTQPTWTGPYAGEGRPWPNGQITHTYDFAGSYTVTVEEEWTAVWHLAGANGTLTGLHTTAPIPNFAVEQLQAVITN